MNNHSLYSISALSTRNPEKKRCGDASFAGVVRINGEDCVILLVADGVSGASKDWLASSSTIQFIINKLETSNLDADEAFRKAIEIANKKIFLGVENTRGMLSTLSAVLFQPSSKKIYLYNVGDSRIYGLKNANWIQLTTDDSSSIPYKENGKLKLQNGVPIMLSGLTKAIGDSENLEVVLEKIPVSEYEILLLASDGFYNLLNFFPYASLLANTTDINNEALKIQSLIISEIKDDASFAVFRLPYNETINLRAIVEQDNENQAVSVIAVLGVLEMELKQAITLNESDYLEKLLHFMERKYLFFKKEKMIEILNLMIKNECVHIQKMVSLIKKL